LQGSNLECGFAIRFLHKSLFLKKKKMHRTAPITPGQVDLKIEQATFSRQNRPVFHIDWHLQPNEQWAVYGPVGAGKPLFCGPSWVIYFTIRKV